VHTPFLCIEPWYGLCDEQGFNGSIQERPYMQALEAGKTWENDLVITFYK
jgi:galactose mutarotase-like enzyme